ncbi:hypothetical protein [Aquimarina rubra]|uniref:Natural product n=1 Tax=Aquimarina rubra TaxID=1920033 RepID=A0ABW5LC21_9FLAO
MLKNILELQGVQKLSINQRKNTTGGGFGYTDTGEDTSDWNTDCRPSNCHPDCHGSHMGCI